MATEPARITVLDGLPLGAALSLAVEVGLALAAEGPCPPLIVRPWGPGAVAVEWSQEHGGPLRGDADAGERAARIAARVGWWCEVLPSPRICHWVAVLPLEELTGRVAA